MSKTVKLLVVEDELLAFQRLEQLLLASKHDFLIVKHTETVESTVRYLQTQPEIDLVLMDIHLGDGLSLEVFQQVKVSIPVIFTTAYDAYALRAFKTISVDYLLKPIELEALDQAVDKYFAIFNNSAGLDVKIEQLRSALQPKAYKSRFSAKSAQQIYVILLQEVAYFYTEDGYTILQTIDGKRHFVEDGLEQLQKDLDPEHFFRINRSMIVKLSSIVKVEHYFNSRYSLSLLPAFNAQVLVSRERAKDFRNWLG